MSGAEKEPIHFNKERAYILKSHNLSTRLLVGDFSVEPSNGECLIPQMVNLRKVSHHEILRKANGRLHLHLLGTLVYCNGTALNVVSRGAVVRVFRDALDHCVAPQNPREAIPRDGSFDRSVGRLELREEWRMHRVAVLSNVH